MPSSRVLEAVSANQKVSYMKPDKKKRTQAEEMALAAKEGRQPVCVYCGHPLDRVSETQHRHISWASNAKMGGYYQDAIDDSDKPYHECLKCPDGCGVHDPDFAGNDLIYY